MSIITEEEEAKHATYVILLKIQKQHIQVNKETKIPWQSGLHVREQHQPKQFGRICKDVARTIVARKGCYAREIVV